MATKLESSTTDNLQSSGEDSAASIICWVATVLPGTALGAVGTAGNPLGIALGFIAGLAAGNRLCGKGQVTHEAIKRWIQTVGSNPDLSSCHGTLKSEYGVNRTEAKFLTDLAMLYVRRGGDLPQQVPSKSTMKHAIARILQQKPKTRVS